MSFLPYGTYIGPVARGPAVVEILGAAQFGAVSAGASIPTSSSLSTTIVGAGFSVIGIGLTTTQNGTVSLTPYLDAAATVALAPATTQSLSGGTASVFSPILAQPFASLVLSVSNSSTAGASTISSMIGLLQGATDPTGALSVGGGAVSSSNPLPTMGRPLVPVKLDSTTGASGWSALADLSASPGGYLEVQNRGTATMVIQIGGATGGDTTGSVETIAVLGSYLTPSLNTQAKFFVSSGASGAAISYGGWKA